MTSRLLLLLTLVAALGTVGIRQAPAAERPEVVVVCPPAFRADLRNWIDYRRQQGYAIELLEPASALKLQQQIRQILQPGGAVLLVGDVPGPGPVFAGQDPVPRPEDASSAAGHDTPHSDASAVTVPTWYVPATVIPQFGGEPNIATDVPYGDLDDDGIPDLAVGRFPADTPSELAQMVAKTLDYEKQQDFGPWRRQIHLMASNGGFGPLVDGAIERVTRQFLTQSVPAGYSTDVSFANWQSPYCPNLFALRDHAVETLGEASMAWVYLGHGRPDRLVAAPSAPLPALSVLAGEDAMRIAAGQPRPIAFLLACYTSALDTPHDCLSEDLVRAPGGPVAVLGGTRLTMPYGMAVLGTEILHQWFEKHSDTLGQMVMRAKRAMLDASDSPRSSRWLDAIAWPLHPQRSQMGQERREHVQLFQLLGDPLLRIHHPQPVALQVPGVIRAGESLQIHGESPVAGRAVVELICQPDQFTFVPPARTEITADPQTGSDLEALRQRANDHRWWNSEIQVPAGEFSVVVPVPAHAHGPSYARVFVQGTGGCALGAAPVEIE